MKVINKKNNIVLGENIVYANSLLLRTKGLMFEKTMIGDGLLLEPAKAIHNCFVRFPIDVLFIDKNLKVVGIIKSFKPWRFSKFYWRAQMTLELPEGTINEDVVVGDQLEVQGV